MEHDCFCCDEIEDYREALYQVAVIANESDQPYALVVAEIRNKVKELIPWA